MAAGGISDDRHPRSPHPSTIASSLASRYGRGAGKYEFQMLYGIGCTTSSSRLADAGEDVRV